MNWLTYSRGTIYPNWFTLALVGHCDYSAKLTGVPIVESIFFDNGSKLVFAWGGKRINALGRHTLKLCSTSQERRRHFNRFGRYIKNAISGAEKIYTIDLCGCSNGELINLYDFMLNQAAPSHGFLNVDIDAFDIYFGNFLQKKIREQLRKKIDEEEFLKLYEAISVPAYKTYLSQEDEVVFKLSLKKNITQDDFKELYNRYWWTGLGWENLIPHSENYFISRIRKIKDKTKAKEKLKEIRKHAQEIKQRRLKLLKKYGFEKISVWLEFLDKYAYYHEARKEMQVKTNYALRLIMLEAAKRLGLSKADLNWLWGNEVKKLLQGGKLNKEEISRRKEAILTLINDKGLRIFSGAAAIKKYKSENREMKENVKIAKGYGAMRGKVTGTAKVCSGLEEALRKIKKGDILICGMTTPDYISVMKKVVAIVTDEGGLTCHAAIISRELKIPCVVGTRIATKIFNDGDLIEVDASKGIVKILKLT